MSECFHVTYNGGGGCTCAIAEAELAKLEADNARLLKWLEAISTEADEWDDHDGKCLHISFGTLMQARQAIREVTA